MSTLPLYPRFTNPLLFSAERGLPGEVAVVGAGNIGAEIGYYLKTALPGSRLIMADVSEKQLKDAEKKFQDYTQKSLDKKKMKPEAAKNLLDSIIYTSDYAALKNTDLVIEAATEDLETKRMIITTIEDSVRDDTIITSNSGLLPAERIFSGVKNPSRMTVTHFFDPVRQNPDVEVITWAEADQNVLDYLRWMFCITGKIPYVSSETHAAAPVSGKNILLDEIDGVKIITIKRPQLMNALNVAVNREIVNVIKEYESDPSIKGFVITSYGNRVFSAGADLDTFPRLFDMLGDVDNSAKFSVDNSELLRYIDSCNKPVVAAVNGVAIGGGCELAFRCHKIVSVENAWFQLPEVNIGLVPGLGGLVVPYRRWPKSSKLFHDMNRQAARMTAKVALEEGIVSALVSDYYNLVLKAVQEVKEMAGKPIPRISDNPVEIAPLEHLVTPMSGKIPLSKEVVGIIDKAIQEAAAKASLAEALEVGYIASGVVALTEGAKEGILAFMQKRAPEFKQ